MRKEELYINLCAHSSPKIIIILITTIIIKKTNQTELLNQDARGEEGQLRVHVPELHLPIICIPLEDENGQLIPMLELLHEKNQFEIGMEKEKREKENMQFCRFPSE